MAMMDRATTFCFSSRVGPGLAINVKYIEMGWAELNQVDESDKHSCGQIAGISHLLQCVSGTNQVKCWFLSIRHLWGGVQEAQKEMPGS